MNTEQQIKIDDDQLFGKVYKPSVVKRLIPYLKGRLRLVILALVATALWSISHTAMPFMIKIAIDEYITKGKWNGLIILSIVFILVMLFNSLCSLVMEISCVKIGQHVLYRLKKDMFGKIQQLSLGFFDKTEIGRLISRVQGDVYQIGEFFSMLVTGLADFAVLFWIIGAILLLNWKLGLISMVVIPCLVAVMWYWQPRAKIGFVFSRTAISAVNSYLNQNISGVRVVQAMNRQKYNAGQFDSLNQDNKTASLRASKLSAGLIPPVDFLTGVSIALALFFGAMFAQSGSMEIGSIVAFVLYIQRFFDPIRSVTMQYTQLQRSMTSGERIFELMDQQSDVIDKENARGIGAIKGEVEYKKVSFSYDGETEVIKNLNLHIKPGTTNAIVGPTGAGKTTLVSLLSRFYDVDRSNGAILIDGNDIRDVSRESMINQMASVLQEPYIFTGTVRENIKYRHEQVTEEEMISASKAVGCHDLIMKLPEKYNTMLDERGSNLSLGERQLISFARALVANPKILILDEATANIDSHTEQMIQNALSKLLLGRTSIIIAHRLSTIRDADKIIVLKDGEVVEEGGHQELVDKNGLYKLLHDNNLASLSKV